MEGSTVNPIEKMDVDAILVTDEASMRYLSGFSGEGYIFVDGSNRAIVTDSRYTIAAKEEAPDWDVYDMCGKKYEPLCRLIHQDAKLSIGFEDNEMTFSEYSRLVEATKEFDVAFVPLKGQMEKLRYVKTQDELAKIKKAEAIGDLAFSKILPHIAVGVTERKIAALLEFYMKEAGADGLSFDTIAASGPNSAKPHSVPSDRELQKGDFLTMDFGCRFQGYCSDMTRTVVVGKASERQVEIYETVLEAQRLALQAVRPNVMGKEIDKVARDYIASKGFGAYFGHGLGHSVGLKIHEAPCFSPREETILKPGMVITVEPGIYIENEGGVRIEDVVCVTEEGCINLTESPKQLMIL